MTTMAMATIRVPRCLAEHVQKAREVYEHARDAQEGLLFSAWLNSQRELAEFHAKKHRMQITWALLGGPLGRVKEA